MVFYHNYVNQCNKKGMSPSAAAEAMGFKRSMVTRWKDGSQPRQATLQRMADFFGCSVTDLTAETEKAPADDGEGITKEQIKIALFGDDAGDISDEDLDNAVQFARFSARERKQRGDNK